MVLSNSVIIHHFVGLFVMSIVGRNRRYTPGHATSHSRLLAMASLLKRGPRSRKQAFQALPRMLHASHPPRHGLQVARFQSNNLARLQMRQQEITHLLARNHVAMAGAPFRRWQRSITLARRVVADWTM